MSTQETTTQEKDDEKVMRKKHKQEKRRLIKIQSYATFHLHNYETYQGIFTRKFVL